MAKTLAGTVSQGVKVMAQVGGDLCAAASCLDALPHPHMRNTQEGRETTEDYTKEARRHVRAALRKARRLVKLLKARV